VIHEEVEEAQVRIKKGERLCTADAGHGSGSTRARTRLGKLAVALCTVWSAELGAGHSDERRRLRRSDSDEV
jgi:hypothetical protein